MGEQTEYEVCVVSGYMRVGAASQEEAEEIARRDGHRVKPKAELDQERADYVGKRYSDELEQWDSAASNAQAVANNLKSVCGLLGTLNFGRFVQEPEYVKLAHDQFRQTVAVALPQLVAALGSAGVILDHRIEKHEEMKTQTAEQWWGEGRD